MKILLKIKKEKKNLSKSQLRRNRQTFVTTASATFASLLSPSSHMHQLIDQVEANYRSGRVLRPFCTSILMKSAAWGRLFKSFLHIHDPIVVASTSQNELLWSRYCLTQATLWKPDHSEQLPNETSCKWRISSPPMFILMEIFKKYIYIYLAHLIFFGKQTSAQPTLALVKMFGGPLHRNYPHLFPISLKQPLGNRKTEHQKLYMLEITASVSCRCPTKDKCLDVQLNNLLRILSSRGS